MDHRRFHLSFTRTEYKKTRLSSAVLNSDPVADPSRPGAMEFLRRVDRAHGQATAESPPIKRNEVCISRRGNADATRHALIMHFSACSLSFFHFFLFFSPSLSHFAIVGYKTHVGRACLSSCKCVTLKRILSSLEARLTSAD